MTFTPPRVGAMTPAVAIRTARLLASLDQGQLAEALGVARNTVSNWETGRSEPTYSALVRLARVTDQPLDWFAQAVNDEEPAPEGTGSTVVVRPEGFEPPTYWLGAKSDWAAAA